MTARPARRPLTSRERDALYAMLDVAENLREVLVALKRLGWQPPHDLRAWDDGAEVVRALATDTHSLVRESP